MLVDYNVGDIKSAWATASVDDELNSTRIETWQQQLKLKRKRNNQHHIFLNLSI